MHAYKPPHLSLPDV